MDGRNQPPVAVDPWLSIFELPAAMVRPAVESCRYFNTLVDAIFYDVPELVGDLRRKDIEVTTHRSGKLPSRIIDLGALTDPEGSLLLIDATTEPYVHRYASVEAFLDSPHPETREVDIVTITGVGSSALGSAAFGWDVSVALEKPVLAIVPGYGVADVLLQGLGGYFGFGLHDFLGTKSLVQYSLVHAAPALARLGRRLPATTPEAKAVNGAPVFRYGSGSSDVLHALIKERAARFAAVIGHSKGALQIGNALRSLDPARTAGLHVVTLGCPIAEGVPGAQYHQYLGLFDALGQANMWGHWPEHWTETWHSTNPWLPLTMAAGKIARTSA